MGRGDGKIDVADMLAEMDDMIEPGVQGDAQPLTLTLLSDMHYDYLAASALGSFQALLKRDLTAGRNAFIASVGLRMAPLWTELMDALSLHDTVTNLQFYLASDVLVRLFCNHEVAMERKADGSLVCEPIEESMLVVGWDMASLLMQVGVDLTLPAEKQNPAVTSQLESLFVDVRHVVKHYAEIRLNQKTVAQNEEFDDDPFAELGNYQGLMH